MRRYSCDVDQPWGVHEQLHLVELFMDVRGPGPPFEGILIGDTLEKWTFQCLIRKCGELLTSEFISKSVCLGNSSFYGFQCMFISQTSTIHFGYLWDWRLSSLPVGHPTTNGQLNHHPLPWRGVRDRQSATQACWTSVGLASPRVPAFIQDFFLEFQSQQEQKQDREKTKTTTKTTTRPITLQASFNCWMPLLCQSWCLQFMKHDFTVCEYCSTEGMWMTCMCDYWDLTHWNWRKFQSLARDGASCSRHGTGSNCTRAGMKKKITWPLWLLRFGYQLTNTEK